jgi:hypothetical protein
MVLEALCSGERASEAPVHLHPYQSCVLTGILLTLVMSFGLASIRPYTSLTSYIPVSLVIALL